MKTTSSKFKPFTLVTKDDTKKVIIVAGNTQMSPYEFSNEKAAEAYLAEQPYEMCINLISTLLYYENENKKQNQKDAKKDA